MSKYFDKNDIEDITAKIQASPPYKEDMKMVGKNAALNLVDTLKAAVGIGIAIVEHAPDLTIEKENDDYSNDDGFRHGHSGYGYYIDDIKS